MALPDTLTPLVLAFMIAALVCAVVFVYPYVVYPALLRFLSEKPIALGAPRSTDGGEFTLIFSAYNEAESLPSTLEHLGRLRARYPRLEILAYDDCSQDETAAMLETSVAGISVVRAPQRTGKAHGMKVLARRAHGELLVCIDANVLIDVDALDRLLPYYDDPSVGGVAGHLVYVNAGDSATSATGGSYWRLEERIKRLEARARSTMGADGSVFSVRASLYPTFPDTVQDDFAVSMSVIYAGYRLVWAPDVVAREEHTTNHGVEFARKVRIGTRAFHTHLWMAERRRATFGPTEWFMYLSHKWVRWHGLFALALAAAFALTALSLHASILGVVAGLLCAVGVVAASRTRRGPLASLTSLVAAVTATGLGVVRARRGVVQPTWATPRQRDASDEESR